MLKKISLTSLSYGVSVLLELLNSGGTSIVICTTEELMFSSQRLWMFLPKLILATGVITALTVQIEFTVAQSPWQTK